MADSITFPTSFETPEDAADKILCDFWDRALPIDSAALSKKMGVQVYSDSSLPASGQLFIDEQGVRIHIKTTEPVYRQRFTIAHELGHLCLGHGSRPRQDNSGYSLYNFDPVERDANRFAVALIMPSEAMKHYQDVGTSFADLVRNFNVSGQAMRIRLIRLGLL